MNSRAPTDRLSWRARVASLFWILAAPAAVGGGLALAPLQAIFGFVAGPWASLPAQLRRHGLTLAPLILFALWAAASCMWSPVAAGDQAVKIIGGVFGGLMFVAAGSAAPKDRALIRAAGIACVLVLAALSLIEAFGDMPLNRLAQPGAETGVLERNPGKGVSVLIALCWPAMAALLARGWISRTTALALLIGVGVASWFFSMNANALCFAIGLTAFAIAYILPRMTMTAIAWAFAAWMLAAPFVCAKLFADERLTAALPMSWRMRAQIWNYASARIAEQPLIGHGLDAAHTFDAPARLADLTYPSIPLHPHSFSLHVWLETGAIGAGLFALALLIGGWAIGRALSLHRLAAAAASASAASIGVMWNLSYGAWQEWWIAIPFAAAALILALVPDRAHLTDC